MNENIERNYSVKLVDASRELTKREILQYKDFSSSEKLDELVTPDTGVDIDVKDYAIFEVHNESAERQDYTIFVIVDNDGNRFSTSSPSFMDAFGDIASVMENEPFAIHVYKKESKNYKGKHFMSCTIL